MISTLLEKLECHSQPAKLSAFTLHLCYLMLLEPLAAPVEFFLLQKCKSSLHHALQVYWFCQGMIEDHDESPGPSNYQRFLRMQREVQAEQRVKMAILGARALRTTASSEGCR